jgi:O-antigen/teichoic acid export membrane protein
LLWTIHRLRAYFSRLPKPSLPLFKANLHYGLKAYLAAFFAFLVLRIDLLMIKYMLDAKQVGYYSIAVSMADLTYMLPVVIGSLLFPKLSALSDGEKKWKLTRKIALGVGVLMLFAVTVSSLLAGVLVRFLFGDAYLPAVPAFIWLMPGIVMLSINVILMNYFASTGMPMVTVYSPALAAGLNIAMNLKLIPSLGIRGASVSSVASYGLMLGCSFVYLWNKKDERSESRLSKNPIHRL